MRLILIMVLAFLGMLAISDPAEARTCKGTASGWGVNTDEINGDGVEGGGSVSTGTGRDCFGNLTTSGAGELAEWDQHSYCDFDDTGYPSGVLLNYLSLSQVIRYRNGDLVMTELSESFPSTLCFNYVDGVSYTVEVYSVVIGGTGRFEGATGTSVTRGAGQNLQNMGAWTSEFESDLTLQSGHPHKNKEDKEDEDD
jgi:hypothetical protein